MCDVYGFHHIDLPQRYVRHVIFTEYLPDLSTLIPVEMGEVQVIQRMFQEIFGVAEGNGA